jgi:hypothetical protein
MRSTIIGALLVCGLVLNGCAVEEGEGDLGVSGEDLTAAEGEGVSPENEDAPAAFEDVTDDEVAAEEASAELAPAQSAVRLQGEVGLQASQASQVVSKRLFAEASAYFKKNQARIPNKRYYVIVDFSKHNGEDRFFLVNGATGAAESHVVAHGTGSDPSSSGYTKYVSNTPNSRKSSEGAYLTSRTGIYMFRGYKALRLDGLSPTNSNARSRGILLHRGISASGNQYVSDSRSKQGNSWGCFALDPRYTDSIVEKIRGGALIYAKK